jgi:hypothetical protein
MPAEFGAWPTVHNRFRQWRDTGVFADLIESMISRDLNKRQIWIELMDHHDYLVKYHSIRHYIDYTRSRTADPPQPAASPPQRPGSRAGASGR